MPSPIKLDNTLGAAFIGNIFAAVFYGITNVQTFSYYKHNGKDPQYMKILIFILWVLDSLHLALITHTLYTYTVKDFTDLLAITIPTWSIVAVIAVEGISDLFVRSYFCYRVWRLSKRSWILGIAIGVLTLLVFGTNISFAIECYRVFSYFELAKISWILYLSFAAALTADFIIAISLCWLLARHRTGFQRTDSIIRILMLYSVNTCVLTTIFAFCCLITFIKMPDNFVYIAFYFAMPKMFLNSLLATLNTRKHVREIGSSAAIMSIPLSAISGTRTVASADSAGKPQYSDTHEEQVLHVQIQTTVDKKTDSVTNINV